MKYIANIFLIISLLLSSFSVFSDDAGNLDRRISLNLTKSERAYFLSEMRKMLSSIQGVIRGIGEHDRELIINSAGYSGNRMARATPESVKQKTPQLFKEIGGSTHMMFEELVVRAQDDDMETLTVFTSNLMKQCLSCHEIFRAN